MADAQHMLADGSNPENVDPSPPLEWAKPEDIKDVTVFGGLANPPVTKIRAHLAYNSISYKCVSRSPNKQPEGHYQKIPSVVVNGRQVNDSFIILKNLVPALYGNLSEKELAWEEKITYSVMIAMEVEGMEDGQSLGALLALGGYPSFLAWIAFPFLPVGAPGKKIPTNIRTRRSKPTMVEKYGELKKCVEYLKEFKDEVGDKPFFGGDKPGAVDISLFATFRGFITLSYTGGVLQEAGLTEWYERVKAKVPANFENDTFA